MTDQTEAPEQIWATGCGLPAQEESGTFVAVGNKYPTAPNADALAYIRKDLSDAKDKRIDELEAKLAKAARNLKWLDSELKEHGYFAQGKLRSRCRTTLAEIKGGKDG